METRLVNLDIYIDVAMTVIMEHSCRVKMIMKLFDWGTTMTATMRRLSIVINRATNPGRKTTYGLLR